MNEEVSKDVMTLSIHYSCSQAGVTTVQSAWTKVVSVLFHEILYFLLCLIWLYLSLKICLTSKLLKFLGYNPSWACWKSWGQFMLIIIVCGRSCGTGPLNVYVFFSHFGKAKCNLCRLNSFCCTFLFLNLFFFYKYPIYLDVWALSKQISVF